MPITAKPFSAAARIVKAIFMPEPNVFANEDLNRYLDADLYDRVALRDAAGMLRENGTITVNTLTDTPNVPGAGDITVAVDIDVAAGYLYHKGVRLNIPAGNHADTFVGTGLLNSYCVYLVLVATRESVTFVDDPVLSGISSSEFPTDLPGAEHEILSSERLELTDDPSSVVLGSGEELIGVIAYFPEKVRYTALPTTVVRTRELRYGAPTAAELSAMAPFIAPTGNVNYTGAQGSIGLLVRVADSLAQLWSRTATLEHESWKTIGVAGTLANGQPVPGYGAQSNNTALTGNTALAIRKRSDGDIELSGYIYYTGTQGVLFTLPTGYRGGGRVSIQNRRDFATGDNEPMPVVMVAATGDVRISDVGAAGFIQFNWIFTAH